MCKTGSSFFLAARNYIRSTISTDGQFAELKKWSEKYMKTLISLSITWHRVMRRCSFELQIPPQECSGHGKCSRTGECQCDSWGLRELATAAIPSGLHFQRCGAEVIMRALPANIARWKCCTTVATSFRWTGNFCNTFWVVFSLDFWSIYITKKNYSWLGYYECSIVM